MPYTWRGPYPLRRVSCITRVSVSKLPKGPGPGHFEWARTALPWLIEGSLRVSTIPIVVQPACADLPRLRALRDAVLRDPTLREAITTSRRSNGVGFSIDTEAMRLRMFLEESLASPKLVEHLENTFGVDNLDVGTITLLPGDPG